MDKIVVDGVYSTQKMHVELHEDHVLKRFAKSGSYKQRFKKECQALKRMQGLEGVPTLLDTADEQSQLTLSRLAGEMAVSLSENQVQQLRIIVANMLSRGVARHSLPIRDLLIDDQGHLSMVDFERVSLRGWAYSPIWLIARFISHYHLYRLINEHQPAALTLKERRILAMAQRCRHGVQSLFKLRDVIRGSLSTGRG